MIVDLFAGPGGLDHGAELEGHDTHGIEWDAGAVATRLSAGLATTHGDVRNYGPADFPDATVLAGGPPCQTFAVAGKGQGRAVLVHLLHRATLMAARDTPPPSSFDKRSLLVLEPLRWILSAADMGRPYRAVVLEQVPQVLPIWQAYVDILRAEGYRAACGILNAERYGVPQIRRRAVLVARRDGLIGLPAATHQPWSRRMSEVDSYLHPVVSMGDVLPGRGPFTVISNYGTGGDARKRGRRASTEPAFTVTGKISRNRIVDQVGTEMPRFTHAEAGRLQGFPIDWPWSGTGIPQQIGNAVPPPLAAALFRAALEPAVQLLGVAA